MEHMSTCIVSCRSGSKLLNGESQITLICDDGKWSEEDVRCENSCPITPMAPDHGTVSCFEGVCIFL